MLTFSYLVTPVSGQTAQLVDALNSMDYCEAMAADNEELVVLVTETPDQISETALQQHLKNLPQIQFLSMTFGHTATSNLS